MSKSADDQHRVLKERAALLENILSNCTLCPHQCKINRAAGEKGFCQLDAALLVSSATVHHGEEPPISGTRGSGTIFFSRCNLRCQFCQNYQISQEGLGHPTSAAALARLMLGLQAQGCHNINLVSPTQVVPQIMQGLVLARAQGLTLPLVYNTNGYDALETLRLLDGIIDIYLPDIKYSDNTIAARLSSAKNYVEHNQRAIIEMYRQVGPLQVDRNGIAQQGLIIRHLVLPDNLAGSYESIQFLAENNMQKVRISVMAQYHPAYHADRMAGINRPITVKEYQQVLDWFVEFGFENLLVQELESNRIFLPDFKKEKPFEQ